MPFNLNGKVYSSKKHPMLEYIFEKYNPEWDASQQAINFTLKDVSEGYRALGISEPASISNTILDLTRKKGSVSSRLPRSIHELGYDLKKKTGVSPNGDNYAGTFVFVGVGNELQAWLTWTEPSEVVRLSSEGIPPKIRHMLRKDEGALFSVIDYCDVLSQALYDGRYEVMRVQNPMKWQPNEIDGFYYGHIDGLDTVFPVEAKALTTRDDINLVQLEGGVTTVMQKLDLPEAEIIPLAAQMVENGIRLAIFEGCRTDQSNYDVELVRTLTVVFDPPIESWQ